MILASIATLALSASAALPLGNLLHFHPKAPTAADTRIAITLVNSAPLFRDVRVDGHTYTVQHGQRLIIKAPAGTLVYAESTMPTVKRGAVLLQVTPQVDHQTITLD